MVSTASVSLCEALRILTEGPVSVMSDL